MDRQEAELREQLASERTDHTIELERVRDDLLKLTMANEISFDLGSAAIKPAFKPTMHKLAEVLRKYDRNDITIIGHTDSSGSESYNQLRLCTCGFGRPESPSPPPLSGLFQPNPFQLAPANALATIRAVVGRISDAVNEQRTPRTPIKAAPSSLCAKCGVVGRLPTIDVPANAERPVLRLVFDDEWRPALVCPRCRDGRA